MKISVKYAYIYDVISHLFEPPWVDDQGSDVQLPSVNFSTEILNELNEESS